MILTDTRLRAVLELMGGSAPAGFAEEAMAEFGPGSAWALGDAAQCPPDTWCEDCGAEHCNASAPPLFEILARIYLEKTGYDVVERDAELTYEDDVIPF